MKRINLIIILYFISSFILLGQIVESGVRNYDSKTDSSNIYQENEQEKINGLYSASLTAPVGVTPQANVKTFKFSTKLLGLPWDVFITNSVPIWATNQGDSSKSFANELINQLGGSVNLSFSTLKYLAYGNDDFNKDIRGIQLDFRIGAKALDKNSRYIGENIGSYFIPTLQSSLDFRFLIPFLAFGDYGKGLSGKEYREKVKMLMSLRLFATGQTVLYNRNIYATLLKTLRGNSPSPNVFTINSELNISIIKQFYFSLGGGYSNLLNIEEKGVKKFRIALSASFLKDLGK